MLIVNEAAAVAALQQWNNWGPPDEISGDDIEAMMRALNAAIPHLTKLEPGRPQTGAEAVAELSRDDLTAAGDALTERFDRLERLLCDQWTHRFDTGQPPAELEPASEALHSFAEPTEAEQWSAALAMAAAHCHVASTDDQLFRKARWFYNELMLGPGAGCPTCSGPLRSTVGMVCQTCGTDYGRPTPPVEPPKSKVRIVQHYYSGAKGGSECSVCGKELDHAMHVNVGPVIDSARVPGDIVDMDD
jgi:hypothetical protein